MNLEQVILRGLAAARPAANTVAEGSLYYSTDTITTDRSNGSAWETYADSGIVAVNAAVPRLAAPFVSEPEEVYDEPQIYPSSPAILTAFQNTRQIGITIDGGGSAITTGVKGYKSFPVAGIIIAVRMLADQTGSAVVDIWKDTFANYPPTVADTITASAKPTISAANKSEDTTLTGWTKTVAAGDVFGFNVDSAATITRLTLELTILVA